MLFFVGLHDPHLAARFTRCMISIARPRRRVSGFAVGDWMLDSGAFSDPAAYVDRVEALCAA
jgi:hypothetical protein